MKKILFISNIGSKKVGSFSRSSYEASIKLGYEFHIIANLGEKESNKKVFRDGEAYLHHYDCSRNPFNIKNIKAYKQLLQLMEDEKFDIVHCNTPIGGLLGRIAAKKKNVKKVIYTVHGFHFYKGNKVLKNFIFRNVEKFLAKYTDVIITINKEDYEAAQKFKVRNHGKVYKVNGV